MPAKVLRPPLTHFLCLPLITESSRPVMEKSLSKFRTELLNDPSKYDVPDLSGSVMRPIGTIHITLGVMSLREQEKLDAAKQLLSDMDIPSLLKAAGREKTCSTAANEMELEADRFPLPLSISLRSIMPMQSAVDTSVLYTTPVDISNRLMPFCQSVKRAFEDSGLMISDSRPLKLHATILNTIYGSKNQKGKKRGGPSRFDASKILEQFEAEEWTGEYQLEKLVICKMGAKKVLDEDGNVVDEAYEETATRDLPR